MAHFYTPKGEMVNISDHERGAYAAALAKGLTPSVTTYLSIIRHEALERWKRFQACRKAVEVGDAAEACNWQPTEGSEFGTIAHACIEAWLKSEQYPKDATQAHLDAIEPFKTFWVGSGLELIESELGFFEPGIAGVAYGGTVDIIAWDPKADKLCILDMKFRKKRLGMPIHLGAEYSYQMAAYGATAGKRLGVPAAQTRTCSLILTNNTGTDTTPRLAQHWWTDTISIQDSYAGFCACARLWEDAQKEVGVFK